MERITTMKKAILVIAAMAIVFTAGTAAAGGLNLKFSRCDIMSNYKPVEGNFDKIKAGVKILAPWDDRILTASGGVFLWAEADYRPTLKARYDGARADMWVPANEAKFCEE